MSDREEAIKNVMKSYGNTASAVYHDEWFINETMDFLRKNLPDNSFPVMNIGKMGRNDRSYGFNINRLSTLPHHIYDNKIYFNTPKIFLTLENQCIPTLKPNEFVNMGKIGDIFKPLIYIKNSRFKYTIRRNVILGYRSHIYDDMDKKIIQYKVDSIIPRLNNGYGLQLVYGKHKKVLDSVYNQCKLEHWFYIKYFRLSMI